jgi:hypothetical protein
MGKKPEPKKPAARVPPARAVPERFTGSKTAPEPRRPAPTPPPRAPAARANLPAPRSSSAPASLQQKMEARAGQGVSNKQEDNLIPLIYVLQQNSPACDTNNPAHFEGAQPGNLWLRNAAEPIIDQSDGMEFQPCFFDKDWVEWIPRKRGGGLVNRHRELPDDAEQVEDPERPGRVIYKRPNGNEVIETRYFIGYVLNHGDGAPLAYCIPLSSTGHTFAKGWMMMMNQHIMPKGGVEPAFSRSYLIRTRYRTKDNNSWYMLEIAQDMGFVDDDQFDMGANLRDAFTAGQKQVDMSAEEADIEEDTGAM